MPEQQRFIQEVSFALHHLFHWIHTNAREDVFQNIPTNIPRSWQEKLLAEKLYSIYAFDYRFIDHVTNAVEQQLTASIEQELTIFRKSLQTTANLINVYSKNGQCAPVKPSREEGWFFSGSVDSESIPDESIKYRIYVNAKSERIAEFVQALIEEQRRSLKGQGFKFKFAAYWNVDALDLMRPEKIVIYLPPETNYSLFLTFLSRKTNLFLDEAPMFAKQYCKGVAIAPHMVESLRDYLGVPSNSFGDAVCHIIARSLLSWIKRFGKLPQPEDFNQIGQAVYTIVMKQGYLGER